MNTVDRIHIGNYLHKASEQEHGGYEELDFCSLNIENHTD